MKTLAAVLGACLAAVVPAQAQAPAPGAVSNDVVRIGLVLDMTSLYSDITGTGSVTAARMAVEGFRRQGAGKARRGRLRRPPEQA